MNDATGAWKPRPGLQHWRRAGVTFDSASIAGFSRSLSRSKSLISLLRQPAELHAADRKSANERVLADRSSTFRRVQIDFGVGVGRWTAGRPGLHATKKADRVPESPIITPTIELSSGFEDKGSK